MKTVVISPLLQPYKPRVIIYIVQLVYGNDIEYIKINIAYTTNNFIYIIVYNMTEYSKATHIEDLVHCTQVVRVCPKFESRVSFPFSFETGSLVDSIA